LIYFQNAAVSIENQKRNFKMRMFPLKTKSGIEVSNALKEIFKQRKPEKLWTDKGK